MANEGTGVKDCFVSVTTIIESVDDQVRDFLVKTLKILRKRYSNYELVLIANGLSDDAVSDLTSLLQQYPCIRIIRLSRKYSQEVATFAALESAIGDYTILASATTDPPATIPELVTKLLDKNDLVFGVSKQPLPYPLLTRLGRRWFFWYSDRFLQVDIPVNSTYLIGMNRRAVNALTQIHGQHRHIRHISAQVGFKSTVLLYTPNFEHGLPKRSILKSINLALDIAISYSRHPLRSMSKLSLLVSGLNLLIAIYTVTVYLVRNGDVAAGWTTLSLENSIMFFFVFLMLSILAEYVGQIREEMRDQPSYHIMEELTSNVLIADQTRRNIAKE